jgi:rRNA maturation protein Nop10
VTTIRATCPTCGEVELTPDDIELRVCSFAPASTYSFDCPVCHSAVQKPADDRVIQLLISGGVSVIAWAMPEEASELRAGPPISIDDVLDFHLLLEKQDWFDQLLKSSAVS